MNQDMGAVAFTKAERARLAAVCCALGTTFSEFAKQAILQAVDEMEGYGREEAQQRGEWAKLNGR